MSALTRLAARVADLERRVGPDATPAPQSDAPAARLEVKWPERVKPDGEGEVGWVYFNGRCYDALTRVQASAMAAGINLGVATCKRAYDAAHADAPPADDGGPEHLRRMADDCTLATAEAILTEMGEHGVALEVFRVRCQRKEDRLDASRPSPEAEGAE